MFVVLISTCPGLWKFLEDLWVVLSTSDQLLTGTNARGIPGVTAQMAAHRGFSAISRLYQYQLRPSKVVSFTPDVTKPAKQPTKPLLGYESAGIWWAVESETAQRRDLGCSPDTR